MEFPPNMSTFHLHLTHKLLEETQIRTFQQFNNKIQCFNSSWITHHVSLSEAANKHNIVIFTSQ